VNIKKLVGAVAASAITFSVGAATVAPAWAVDNIKPFGIQERINDWAGNPTIGYTVRDFAPSADPVFHNGELYEATVTVDAFGGWANPMIRQFHARAESGVGYPVLADAPGGLSGASVPPGGSTTGKLYFDVVGDVPNSVVYNDGVRDILAWIPGPPVGGTNP
jgi:Domain of unknown function (DUF1942)